MGCADSTRCRNNDVLECDLMLCEDRLETNLHCLWNGIVHEGLDFVVQIDTVRDRRLVPMKGFRFYGVGSC